MFANHSHDADAVRAQLLRTHTLFAPVRARFAVPGVERGGHERCGVTPIWTRKFGAYAHVLHTGVDRFVVEASFDATQLAQVNTTIVALKGVVEGKGQQEALADRVVRCYREQPVPFFSLALLRATEGLLRDFVTLHPEHVCTLDAIMHVAGGEGLRDLVRYFTRS